MQKILILFLFLELLLIAPLKSETNDAPISSQNLILPEAEQFELGLKLFWGQGKKPAAWKAFQTFVFNYPKSPLAQDAQFLLAEAIFSKAVEEVELGQPPDETGWMEENSGGLKNIGKTFKKKLNRIKYLGGETSGAIPSKKDPGEIERASFSEAIQQYKRVLIKRYKKHLLQDTALFRIAECSYNSKDYPQALKYFRTLQKEYPNSYLVGESLLGSAQCFMPAQDFRSAELELEKLTSTLPGYLEEPRVLFLRGIIQFQTGKVEDAISNLEKIKSPESLYYSGQALIKTGKAVEALAKFKELTEKFKESRFAEQASFLIGESIFFSKNYAGAIQEYQNFLNLYPKSALKEGAFFRIAASYFLKKDYLAARDQYVALLKNFPAGEFRAAAMYFIAESYRMTNQLKEASFSYGQLISAMPNSPQATSARFKLAFVTYSQENFTGAVDGFQRFLDWDLFHPWVPPAYLLMGNAYNRLGRAEEAVRAYQQSFDRAPKTVLAESAMSLLNRTKYLQSQYSQITSGYPYILKSLPPSETKWRSLSLIYLGDSYYRQKLYSEAISIFQNVINLYPNHPTAFYAYDGLYWSHFQLGEYEKAKIAREKIKEVRLPEGVRGPEMNSGSYEVANALFNQKKYGEAIANYEQFLKESPQAKENPEAFYRLALSYYRQEYYSQAIAAWEELIKKFPKDKNAEDALFQIADTYFKAQKYENAIQSYRKILNDYPNSKHLEEAFLRIGQSYYNAQNFEKALPEMENFIRKYPKDSKIMETLDILESAMDGAEKGLAKNKELGISLFKGLIQSFPKTELAGECQYRIGKRTFNLKSYALSALEFEKVASLYPNSSHLAESQFYMAESLYLLKKYGEAILIFTRFLQNFPNSEFAPLAYFHLGTAQYNNQNFEGAMESYQLLIQKYPQNEFGGAAYFNLALAQKKAVKLEEAVDSYLKLARNYPLDEKVNFALLEAAKLKLELKQYLEAIPILKDLSLKVEPQDEQNLEIIYLLSEAYLGNNESSSAIASLKTMVSFPIKAQGWKLEALRKLGEIYEKQEQWIAAAGAYEEGSKISTDPKVSASFKTRAKYLRETYSTTTNGGTKKSSGGN
ncbi:MAG: tetratricopeptide repeat protein [Elusimicrobia bacterium]|nr:tetratricopeptide repeat protein [Elusimicrobiota bacterium]